MYQNSHVPKTPYTSLTNCFAEYEHRTLYDAIVVTLAMLFRLTFYYYYYLWFNFRFRVRFSNITVSVLLEICQWI